MQFQGTTTQPAAGQALQPSAPPPAWRRPVLARLAVAITAFALVSAAFALIAWLLSGTTPRPPARNPFGVGIREAADPGTGLIGWILAVQGLFYRDLTTALRGVGTRDGAAWTLIGLGFAYGVFHAAGPGHGKAVISAWILANERALRRGLALAGAAALLQAVVAIVLVGVLAGLLGLTASRMTGVTQTVEFASFGAIALVGAVLLWRKSGRMAALLGASNAAHAHGPGEPCGPGCFHAAMPAPSATATLGSALAAVAAAGVRPCSGAIILLVFALSLGQFPIGVAAVLAMALGTALTTGALASLAVLAKAAALRLATWRTSGATLALAGLEVIAAATILALGIGLATGVAASFGQT